jgi:hypothetical protein
VGGTGDADAGVFDAGDCQTTPGYAEDGIWKMGYRRRREGASLEMGDRIWDMGRWVKIKMKMKMKIKERLQAAGYRVVRMESGRRKVEGVLGKATSSASTWRARALSRKIFSLS